MRESDILLILWDYCAERRSRINKLTARNLFQLQGQNPTMATLGEEGYILNLCNFQWFEWCYFMDQGESFPMQKEALGKVLGPAKNCGNEMAQWILNSNSQIFPCRSLCHLRTKELNNNLVEERKHL